jgi:hypothetical protein
MPLELSPLVDPLLENRNLSGREWLPKLSRRHVVVGIRCDDPPNQLALGSVAGQKRWLARLATTKRLLLQIETKPAFAFCLVETVTRKTVVR